MEKIMNFVEVKHDGVIATNDIFEIFSDFSLEYRKEYYNLKKSIKREYIMYFLIN